MIASKQVCLILMVALLPLISRAQQLLELSITVKVVSEQGDPISNAVVGVGFDQGGNRWIGEVKSESIKGITDSNGLFCAQATCTGSLGVMAEKQGYYKWADHFFFYRLGKESDGPWQPFDPKQDVVTVTLRRIVNPVPMYAKRVETVVPVFDLPLGYDLEQGAWVAPHGKGSVSDFIIQVTRRATSQDDYEASLIVSVARPGDGFLNAPTLRSGGSVLRLSTEAPIVGYQTNVVVKWGRNPSANGTYGDVGDDYQPNYFFRVRSKIDDKGDVVDALYGKVHGAFRVSGILRDETRVSFTYYLNPDGTRNLEFDPARNLFTNLGEFEEVRDP